MSIPSRTRALTLASLCAALGAALPRAARAQPDCAPGSLASYVALGAGGCRVGGIRLHSFAHVVDPLLGLDGARIRLTPRLDAGPGGAAWLGFLVSGPFGPHSRTDGAGYLGSEAQLTFAMDGTTVSGMRAGLVGTSVAGSGDLHATNAVSARLYGASSGVTSYDAFERGLLGASGRVHETTNSCVLGRIDLGPPRGGLGFPPGGGCTFGTDLTSVPTVGSTGRLFELEGFAWIYSQRFDGLPPVGTATAALDGFTGQFLVTGATITATPEPATLALLAGGLLAIAAATPRARRAARSCAAPAASPCAAAAARRAGAPTG